MITAEMLEPVVDTLTANIGVIVPVGITLFAAVLSIKFIPKLFQKFTNA